MIAMMRNNVVITASSQNAVDQTVGNGGMIDRVLLAVRNHLLQRPARGGRRRRRAARIRRSRDRVRRIACTLPSQPSDSSRT
jgi:hypothetical protein